MGKKITQLATITEVADDDLIVGVDVSDTSGSDNGTNKKFTKASLLDGLAPLDPQITGWNPLGEDLVYVSVDDPTGVVKVEGKDITDKLSVGMRLRFTNGGNVINAIITAITFSVDTTITFLHEIDPADSQALYLLTNSAITLPYFSSQKAPFGFPMSPAKWRVYVNTGGGSQANPVTGTYYNIGTSISVPIGDWELVGKMPVYVSRSVANYLGLKGGFGTTNNNVNLPESYVFEVIFSTALISFQTLKAQVSVSSKTTYYMNFATLYDNTLNIEKWNYNAILVATCAYL